ncbi:MAG: Gfo/Idh/MocA family oxidoreductase [Thermoflexales bacterium]|nr:Gfo/Idh/MocA family oxidoreductase [Thermoflexales bacterium]
MTKLHWGLLSTARINGAVIPPIRLSQRSELAGVASRDQAKADAYAQAHDLPRAYGTYEAMLADPAINVIYNPLPNHLHAEWTVKAAEAGKHVLCEKPLALSVAEVDRIVAAARANNVVVAEAFMYKHHPQTLKVLELLKNKPIGDLLAIKGAFTFDLSPRPDDIRWMPDLGGGSIWDVGCYPISFTRLIAQAEPVEVFGWQTTSSSGVDEVFIGQMRFANGLLAQFESGFRSPYRTWMEVVGTRGSLYVASPFKPADRAFITLNYGDRSEQIEVNAGHLYQGEIEDMEGAVLDGKPQRIPLEDSCNNVALILACLESARTGQVVRL